MSQLAILHNQLGRLRRRRWAARWGTGLSILGLSLLAVLVGLFLVNWTADLSPPARLAALGVAALALCVVVWRWIRPWLQGRESEIDLALKVEKLNHIDTDLVAALEFESPAAASWGSPQLTSAVVSYVAEYSEHANLQAMPSAAPLRQWAGACAAACALLALALLIFPLHGQAFFHRMFFLSAMHYPVRTHIDRVLLGGRELNLVGSGPSPRTPYGQPLRFEIHASGELPATGRAELATLADGNQTTIEMAADPVRPGVYSGQLPRLVDDVRCQLYLGDDWTEPCQILAIPLPVVTIALEAVPPAYAAGPSNALGAPAGARQISVVEGTRVAVRLECTNKPLEQAELSIGDEKYPLSPTDGEHRAWRLDPAGTPLAQVSEPVRYEVQVADVDGLELSEPIQGFIRIKSDRPPRVTAALVTQYVLPTGKPKIAYGAADDYGLAQLRLNVQILHEDGSSREEMVSVPFDPAAPHSDEAGLPAAARPKVVQGRFPLDLASLSLVKGDQLKLTLEACDYRGDQPGHWSVCEPLVLHVTDERGVLAAMAETDQRSARQLEAIIQRQLGIGD